MKPRLIAAVALAALLFSVLLLLLQHAVPATGSPIFLMPAAAPLDVVIHEVAWGGTQVKSSQEWIELKNNTPVTVNLSNWRLRSTGGTPISTALTGEIPPLGYFLMARTTLTNVEDVPADMVYSGALNDSGAAITLTDGLGNVIDTANSGAGAWPAGNLCSENPPCASMERVNPLLPDSDWATNDGVIRNGHDVNGNLINGTPGQPNSATPAELSIVKSAPDFVLTNHAITYTLAFKNLGGNRTAGVVISDSLPADVTFITQTWPFTVSQAGQSLAWQIGYLFYASGTLSFTVVVSPALDWTGWLTNTVVITSNIADYRPDNNIFTTTTLVRPPMVDVGIVKTGPASAIAGRELTYTLVVSNAGEAAAPNVVVTDTLPVSATLVRATEAYSLTQPLSGTLVWRLGDMPAGAPPISLNVVITTPPGTFDQVINLASVTTDAGEPLTANNTSTFSTLVTPPPADLVIAKAAPASVIAGREITYTLTTTNAGEVDALGVVVTDTLPVSVTFARQSASYPFTLTGNLLAWSLGTAPTSAGAISWTVTGLVDVNFSGPITNSVQAGTLTYEADTGNNSAQAATVVASPKPVVLLNGVMFDGYQLNDNDEAIQIINVGVLPVNLRNWRVTEGTSTGVTFSGDYTLTVHQRAWLAWHADRFYVSFGFWPDFAVTGALTSSTIALAGTWPGLSNSGGDVRIQDAAGVALDHLVYGNQAPSSGWSGATLAAYGVGGATGQILARVPDERTGLPVPDTDTAADWIQFTGNYTTGQRVLYPGWDMVNPAGEQLGLFWPFTATAPATITLGIAPDNAFQVVSDAIASAVGSIEIEAYELEHAGIVAQVVKKAGDGVRVRVLLEGGPVGGIQPQELWACQQIEAAGGECWFMFRDADARIYSRYRYLHAKFIVIDRQRLVVLTQNLSNGGLPDDNKSDGTWGSRGYVLLIDSPVLAARAGAIFDRDLTPVAGDITRWSLSNPFGFGSPPNGFVPVTVTGGTTTTVRFALPQAVTDATRFELFTAPEAALRQSDALLGLLARAGAGDEVYVEQMYEYADWGDASTPNVRLQACLDAARRGARVRVLLNSGQFGEDYIDLGKNITTTALLNSIARQDRLDLQARMGDPTLYGIHSKLVLVKLNHEGRAYAHVGSLNGSAESSKINREMAIQVESSNLFARLFSVWSVDWNLSGRTYLPLFRRPAPLAEHLLISEVEYNPPGLDFGSGKEWVELVNDTGWPIDLTGWSIGDALTDTTFGAGRYYFPPGTAMQSRTVIVIAQQAISATFRPNFEFVVDPNPALNDPTVPDMIPVGAWPGFGLALANTADRVVLRDAAGNIVDAVNWGLVSDPDSYVPGVAPYPSNSLADGHSLERYPVYQDTQDCSVDFRDQPTPTPGTAPWPD
jgi:cardiolipin synthase